MIIITNQNNKTWRDVQWGENVSHTEENPNYHFVVYNSPLVASYMYPCYEGIENPKLWNAIGENPENIIESFRSKFSKLTTINECNIKLPTNEQRINFGILCAVNVVQYPPFLNWAFKYLKGENEKESAEMMQKELIDKLDAQAQEDFSSSCFAVLASVMIDNPIFTANAAHRAYHDSLELNQTLDLDQIAQIINVMPPDQIAEVFS
jgi:hypothetical protein